MPGARRLLLFVVVGAVLFGMGSAHTEGLLGSLPEKPSEPSSAGGGLPAPPGSPTALVKPFYAHFGSELDPAQRGNFTDPARTVLDDDEALRESGQGGCLDVNMALDNAPADKAQIAASLKTLEAVNGDQAKVVVAFVEDGKPHRVEWKLKKVDGAWKIADLLSVTGEWELSQYRCK
jgi:hypothetical protein